MGFEDGAEEKKSYRLIPDFIIIKKVPIEDTQCVLSIILLIFSRRNDVVGTQLILLHHQCRIRFPCLVTAILFTILVTTPHACMEVVGEDD